MRTVTTLCICAGLVILSGGCSSPKTVRSIEEIKGKWKVVKLQAEDTIEDGREEFEIIQESDTWRAVVTKDGKRYHVDLSIDTNQNPTTISLLKEGVTVATFKITLPQQNQMRWETDGYHAVMEKTSE